VDSAGLFAFISDIKAETAEGDMAFCLYLIKYIAELPQGIIISLNNPKSR
jgi:hypothetical protein